MSRAKQLEQYTLQHPQEVLLVTVETAGELDEIMIFKGFSSSLIKPTDFDPDVPILSEEATIISIDRLKSPYNPNKPQYLEKGLSWQQMQAMLGQ
ncbi:conserved hypothetical protein [Rippkaea orientalis PCC 8801]|uniref:DUF7734 domain-containing protein n=1 Tax=Rippkaea orientalis (strain PCC 8801 / RF-1) TaxID=41431 RepID=B7JZQ0_RIPO1|nr:hypothetical protein [Rippkaea orientalis]ACK64993.1 conserved hypothetical protein [Rippkaea orientalis PCC 8801]